MADMWSVVSIMGFRSMVASKLRWFFGPIPDRYTAGAGGGVRGTGYVSLY